MDLQLLRFGCLILVRGCVRSIDNVQNYCTPSSNNLDYVNDSSLVSDPRALGIPKEF